MLVNPGLTLLKLSSFSPDKHKSNRLVSQGPRAMLGWDVAFGELPSFRPRKQGGGWLSVR